MYNSIFNHRLSRSDHQELMENDYGIPSKKEFPLNDATHVKYAEANFSLCPPEFRIQLAHNIIMKARKFGVNIGNVEVLEWASRW